MKIILKKYHFLVKSMTSCKIVARAFSFVFLLTLPVAVTAAAVTDVPSAITKILDILDLIIILLISLAFVVFLWGVFKYVTTASLEGKAGAKEIIIYGLIGLFVMFSAWGLVKVLTDTFALNVIAPTPPVIILFP